MVSVMLVVVLIDFVVLPLLLVRLGLEGILLSELYFYLEVELFVVLFGCCVALSCSFNLDSIVILIRFCSLASASSESRMDNPT